MKPSELRTLLAHTIPVGLPILITGAPGIGKSDIVDQARRDAGAHLILSHPAVADPTDVKGMPWVLDGHATFLPFGELSRAISATERTVWFLDDLGQASPAVQASYMQLLLARRVNGHALPDCVTFIAATNRRTDRAGVTGILEPVKSRFGAIVELQADLNEWSAWAIDHNMPPELIAFLRFKPDLLSNFQATADLVNSPSPRTWSHVARLLALDLPESVRTIAMAGAVGEGAALEFAAFLALYATLPSIDQILIDPNSVPVPDKPATLYALAGALAHRATDQNFGRVAQYIDRMVQAGHGEFGVLTIRDAMKRNPKITHTAAFVKLATDKELSALIS